MPGQAFKTSNILFVIDKNISDWSALVESVPDGAQVVFIEQGDDGIEVLSQALSQYSNLESIHIFSHGQSGKVQLGTSWLHSQSLQYLPELIQALSSSVSPDGDILLYGCELAQGEAGETFVRELAHLTGADVAASINLTGAV